MRTGHRQNVKLGTFSDGKKLGSAKIDVRKSKSLKE